MNDTPASQPLAALFEDELQDVIERRGSYHPHTRQPFDTVTSAVDEASDHHLVWAEFAFTR